jgi:hypothetical protein
MSNLSGRVVKLETAFAALDKKVSEQDHEINNNIRKNVHNLRTDTHNKLNAQRESITHLKELVLENAHQIKIVNNQSVHQIQTVGNHVMALAEKQEDMRAAVDNNTKVMSQLQGGLKVFVWIVGSTGAIVSAIKIMEML